MLPETAKSKSGSPDSGIVLLTKYPGITSFSSLYTIKHALHTTKVGHTGTLDSFACGLLVVCTGCLTRLAGRITAFDKVYEAVISFGVQTDTLDPCGTVIKTAELPQRRDLESAVKQLTGKILQSPPAFSAVHINGRRASDIARGGGIADIPARPVEVFSAEILDTVESEKGIRYAHIRFHVSKGTYIRCLARDIAVLCGSAGYLTGLMRTAVGCFELKNAAGANRLEKFTIESVSAKQQPGSVPEKKCSSDPELEEEICLKMQHMTPDLASACGFIPVELNAGYESVFYNGKPLYPSMFKTSGGVLLKNETAHQFAVFTSAGSFTGVAETDGKLMKYGFVVH